MDISNVQNNKNQFSYLSFNLRWKFDELENGAFIWFWWSHQIEAKKKIKSGTEDNYGNEKKKRMKKTAATATI